MDTLHSQPAAEPKRPPAGPHDPVEDQERRDKWKAQEHAAGQAPPAGQPGAVHDHGVKDAEHDDEQIPKDLKRPHTLTVIAVALLFVAVLAGLFFLGLKPHEQEIRQAEEDATAINSLVPVVNVIQPKPTEAAHVVVRPADIRPNQETMIYARTSGYLKKLYVDIQDHVKEGQLLAEIDTPEVDAELIQAKAAAEQARANVEKAKADLDLAQRTLERYGVVGGTGATQQERDEKRSARDQAAAAVKQVEASVAAADANVQHLAVLQSFEKVTAPFAGTITARNYDIGALLTGGGNTPGRELFRLTESDTLRVFVSMPQADSSAVKVGQQAALAVRNYPGRTFTGTVARIAGALDPATRTMPFELHFANPKGELFSGMFGEVTLDVSENRPVLLVPTSAMIFNAAGVQLAVLRDGKVHFQPVKVGGDRGTELEIVDGLQPDDEVITNPGERIAEGSAVQVAARPPTKVAMAGQPTPAGSAVHK
jgi:RND family efflux transporter MFP subunit